MNIKASMSPFSINWILENKKTWYNTPKETHSTRCWGVQNKSTKSVYYLRKMKRRSSLDSSSSFSAAFLDLRAGAFLGWTSWEWRKNAKKVRKSTWGKCEKACEKQRETCEEKCEEPNDKTQTREHGIVYERNSMQEKTGDSAWVTVNDSKQCQRALLNHYDTALNHDNTAESLWCLLYHYDAALLLPVKPKEE